MKHINKKVWRGMLGFDPCIGMKQLIIAECEREKLSLAEVCGRYQMPEVFIIGKHEKTEPVDFLGEKMTIGEIEKRFPFKKIVLITTRV